MLALIDADPSLGEPIEHAPDYLRAEAVFAVTHEGALHLEDVLLHGIGSTSSSRTAAQRGSPRESPRSPGGLLGWDDETPG